MDGSEGHESTNEDELRQQRRIARIAPELIAVWIGDTLQCMPVADLPPPVHADCFEGCPACCPPPNGG
jgi:hypothetical protein